MRYFRKIILPLICVLLLSIPTAAFGAENEVNHVRIPISLVPTEGSSSMNSSSIQPNATTINGYLDFWSTVSGDYVTAHWKVTITTPKTYVTHVNLSILWSSGGTEAFHSFNYSTYNNPTYVANEAENAYYISGSHKAQIQGSVSTTQGEAYTIEPTPEYGTIYFVTN